MIANGVAVYYGDFELPEAAALRFIQNSRNLLPKEPQQAMEMAQKAVALVPDGFDANVALGDALLAGRDQAGAVAAYRKALGQAQRMEPSAKARWILTLEKKLKAAEGASG